MVINQVFSRLEPCLQTSEKTINPTISLLRKQSGIVCPIWHKRCSKAVRERENTEPEEKFFEEGESNQAARAISIVLILACTTDARIGFSRGIWSAAPDEIVIAG
jgi:hypothetical protein